MNISFVLLTWNSERYIEKCLDSVFADVSNSRFSFEIFITDNGSKDKTVEILNSFRKKYPDRINLIFLKKNMGTTYSRNLALKKAKGDFIIIMDSDVEVFPGTVEKLINTLGKNGKAGLTCPKLLYPKGTLQKSTDNFPTIFTKIFRYFFLKKIEKRDNRNLRLELREVDYAISAMWVLKREVLEKVGLLDENIFYAPEDVDYCMRIWKAGYRILYNPDVSCIHHTQEISRGLKINRSTIAHVRGLFYYFRKHNCLFKRPKKLKKNSSKRTD